MEPLGIHQVDGNPWYRNFWLDIQDAAIIGWIMMVQHELIIGMEQRILKYED